VELTDTYKPQPNHKPKEQTMTPQEQYLKAFSGFIDKLYGQSLMFEVCAHDAEGVVIHSQVIQGTSPKDALCEYCDRFPEYENRTLTAKLTRRTQ